MIISTELRGLQSIVNKNSSHLRTKQFTDLTLQNPQIAIGIYNICLKIRAPETPSPRPRLLVGMDALGSMMIPPYQDI